MKLASLDSTFTIEGPDDVLEQLLTCYPNGPSRPAAQQHQIVVQPGQAIELDGAPQDVEDGVGDLERLLTCLNTTCLDDCVSLALHAGVVSLGEVAAVFPGESGAGKSTLTAACMMAGLDYVSDEALVLDDRAVVRPYVKPLMLSQQSLALLSLPSPPPPPAGGAGAGKVSVAASRLGALTRSEGLRVGQVFVPRRVSSEDQAVPLARAEAAEALLRLSFNHFRAPARAVQLVASVVREAHVWQLDYSSPASGAATVLAVMSP